MERAEFFERYKQRIDDVLDTKAYIKKHNFVIDKRCCYLGVAFVVLQIVYMVILLTL